MGNKIEVHGWIKDDGGGYTWITFYEGESIIKAIIKAIRVKRFAGLVKVEWRS